MSSATCKESVIQIFHPIVVDEGGCKGTCV